MPGPHKHASILHAWIDGADIQFQSPTTDEWLDVPDVNDLADGYLEPHPLHPDYDHFVSWRIKPE